MADELNSAVQSEPETTIAEEQEKEQPQTLLDPGEAYDGDEEGGQPQDDDFEDIEWKGKSFRAPKGVKNDMMMQADYTRKTQAAADRNRELDEREQRIAQQSQMSDQEFQERATLLNINARYQQLEAEIDEAWKANDPFKAQELQHEQRKLTTYHQQLSASVNQRTEQRSQEAQRATAKRFADTEAWAAQNIPGHSDDIARRVFAYAESEGIDQAQLQREMSPKFYKLLHRAMIGDQALRKPVSAARTQQPAAQPTQTVRSAGGVPAQRSPNDMPMGDYAAAWRKRNSG